MGVTVAVTRVACNTSTGNQTITTTDMGGLTPKAAIFICTKGVTDGVFANDAALSIGAATGASNRWVASMQSEDAVGTSNCDCENNTDEVVLILDTAGAVDGEADFSAWTTNGVTINWGDAPAAAYLLTVILFGGSDLSAHANNIGLGDTINLETNITQPGFEPDLVFTASVNLAADTASSAVSSLGFGVVENGASIVQRCWMWYELGARPAADTTGYFSELYCGGNAKRNALDWGADAANFDASGFSIFTRNDGANNAAFLYLALAFSGAVGFDVLTHNTPTATGNDTETGHGFTPQFVMLGMTMLEVVDTQTASALSGSMGVGVFDADDEYAMSYQVDDGAGTMNTQSGSDNTAIELPDDDGAAGLTASFVSFGSDWTVNYSAVEASAKKFWAVAIEEEAAAAAGFPWPSYKRHPKTNVLLRL